MNKLVPNMRGLPARGFLCALALALAGCTAAEQKPTIIQPVTQPMAYREPTPTYSNPGSIFSESDALLLAHVDEEGGPLNRAPRNSVLAEMFVLQALSAILQADVAQTPAQYVRRHPGGALGKIRDNER